MLDYLVDFLLELVVVFPTVLIALSFHEAAHAFVAYKLGDPTPKYLGRLTLNPIRHLDPIGAICMLIAHFGWAKPVPVDFTNFKHPKRDMALTAMAGPITNLALAFFGCFLYVLTINLLPTYTFEYPNKFVLTLAEMLIQFVYYFGWLNISLAIFNLLPIPPLDGSKVLYAFLPPKPNNWIKAHEREIAIGFMLILIVDSRLLGGYITWLLSFLVNGIFDLFISPFQLMF